MLCELTIENVAVIEKATVHFGQGLHVLSGETGAGKSIVIDSVNAILGNRASRDLVRTGAEKAKIYAAFRNLGEKTIKKLEDAGYEVQEELLLYREIGADGKTKCRLNGMPASLSVVREIGSDLMVIHGQHDSQSLLDPSRHLGILDAYAKNQALHSDYYGVYRELCTVKKQVDALSMDTQEQQRRLELLQFQVQELEAADLQPEEEAELQNRRNRILHAQKIAQQLNRAYLALEGQEDTEIPGAIQQVSDACAALEEVAELSPEFSEMSERLRDLFYALKDEAEEAAGLLERQGYGEEALEPIEERLDLIYRLKQKYGCGVPELLEYLQKARAELESMEFGEEHLAQLYDKQAQLYETAREKAQCLTQSRLEAFERLNEELTESLCFLNMPGIRFSLEHRKGPLASMGQDSVEFFISTNAGEAPKPLAKIASGGELSRIMLAIKSALSDQDETATVIYDEIDTGVSGVAAARIGQKLKETSRGKQVICITHTAQIAALADIHLYIEKRQQNDRVYTHITTLNEEQRIGELARMISGNQITEIARANAAEMLKLAHQEKKLDK